MKVTGSKKNFKKHFFGKLCWVGSLLKKGLLCDAANTEIQNIPKTCVYFTRMAAHSRAAPEIAVVPRNDSSADRVANVSVLESAFVPKFLSLAIRRQSALWWPLLWQQEQLMSLSVQFFSDFSRLAVLHLPCPTLPLLPLPSSSHLYPFINVQRFKAWVSTGCGSLARAR